jgi:hypothetical protein
MMANGAFDVSVDTLSFGATLTAGSLNIAGWDV